MEQFYKTTCESADQAIKTAWKKFEEHPASKNQTYWEHLRTNIEKGTSTCISGGLMITHAVFPFLFQNADEHVPTPSPPKSQQQSNSAPQPKSQQPQDDELTFDTEDEMLKFTRDEMLRSENK